MQPMLHVGLTGNIAAGKSHAAQVFAELGAQVIDADSIAHELMSPGTVTYRKIVEAFGEGILKPDRTIDRKVLGDLVFNDERHRSVLNQLVHPEVHAEILRRIVELEKQHRRGIVIVHAALLVESGHYKIYDRLIVVLCDPSLQVARIVSRNSLNVQQARKRLAAQMPVEEKLKLADYTIETSGALWETREQVEAIYRDLMIEEIKLRDTPE
jgi:dephospho-CoA kinase